jgi:hypothetical protein
MQIEPKQIKYRGRRRQGLFDDQGFCWLASRGPIRFGPTLRLTVRVTCALFTNPSITTIRACCSRSGSSSTSWTSCQRRQRTSTTTTKDIQESEFSYKLSGAFPTDEGWLSVDASPHDLRPLDPDPSRFARHFPLRLALRAARLSGTSKNQNFPTSCPKQQRQTTKDIQESEFSYKLPSAFPTDAA